MKWLCYKCLTANDETSQRCSKCGEIRKDFDGSLVTSSIMPSDGAAPVTDAAILAANNSKAGKTSSNLLLLALLVGSAALFVVAGAFRWNLAYILLLLVAVFIHESGHLLAMKAYHYKNLKMLFLPLVGAVVTGEPTEHDCYKNAMISIFGPFVGLLGALIAIIIGLVTHNHLWWQFASVSVWLNAFNLLPVMPLDGGQFLNEALFTRYPKQELVFKLFAVAVLAWMAWHWQSIFLGSIAFVLLVSVQTGYAMAVAKKRMMEDTGLTDGPLDEAKVGRIRQELNKLNPRFERVRNVKALPGLIGGIWRDLHRVFPSPSVVAFLLAVYLATTVLLVPCSAVMVKVAGKRNSQPHCPAPALSVPQP